MDPAISAAFRSQFQQLVCQVKARVLADVTRSIDTQANLLYELFVAELSRQHQEQKLELEKCQQQQKTIQVNLNPGAVPALKNATTASTQQPMILALDPQSASSALILVGSSGSRSGKLLANSAPLPDGRMLYVDANLVTASSSTATSTTSEAPKEEIDSDQEMADVSKSNKDQEAASDSQEENALDAKVVTPKEEIDDDEDEVQFVANAHLIDESVVTQQEDDPGPSGTSSTASPTPAKSFRCPLCPLTFTYRHKLEDHMNHHVQRLGPIRPFRCLAPGCDYLSGYKYIIQKHIRDRHQALLEKDRDTRAKKNTVVNRYVGVDEVLEQQKKRMCRELSEGGRGGRTRSGSGRG